MSSIINTFGWALAHSVWQGAIVALVLYTVLLIGKRVLTSTTRYSLSIIALWIIGVWSAHTFWGSLGGSSVGNSESSTLSFDLISLQGTNVSSLEYFFSIVNTNMDLVVFIWAIGLFVGALRMGFGVVGIHRLRNSFISNDNQKQLVNKLCSQLGIFKHVEVGETKRIKSPIVLGHLRPLILFPVGYAAGMSAEHLKMIILHELAHIKRNDFIVHFLQQLFTSIYFFNPFVWWISGILNAEREYACDDIVLASTDSREYSKALLAGYDQAQSPVLTLGLGGKGQNITTRINRIMKRKTTKEKGNLLSVSILVALFIGFVMVEKNGLMETKEQQNVRVASFVTNPISLEPVGFNIDLGGFEYMDTIPEIKQRTIRDDFKFDYEDIDDFVNVEMLELISVLADFEMPDISIPPFPIMNFDTIIPMKKLLEMEEMMERMELEQYELMSHLRSNEKLMEKQMEMAEMIQREVMERMEEVQWDKFDQEYKAQFEQINELMEESINLQLKELNERMLNLPDMNFDFDFEEMIRIIEKETRYLKEFEIELKKVLKKDGYWNEDEKLNIKLNEDSMEINGKEIKGKKYEKYRKIKEKYFPEDETFRYESN